MVVCNGNNNNGRGYLLLERQVYKKKRIRKERNDVHPHLQSSWETKRRTRTLIFSFPVVLLLLYLWWSLCKNEEQVIQVDDESEQKREFETRQ